MCSVYRCMDIFTWNCESQEQYQWSRDSLSYTLYIGTRYSMEGV